MRFKMPDLEQEFQRAHPRVQAMAYYLDAFTRETLGHDLMVTSVERTQAEYDAIYNQSNYDGPKPHLADADRGLRSRAVDFRTSGEISDDQARALVLHMNQWFPRRDLKPTAIFHDVAGPHLHIQAEGT